MKYLLEDYTLEERLIIVESERDYVIRAAARMADALQDIYDELGNFKEVYIVFKQVYSDVSCYKGLTEKGLGNEKTLR